MTSNGTSEIRIELRPRVTCPHCWTIFAPEDTRWIAVHPDLQHDSKVDPGGLRFLPTRFNVEGNAIDPRGQVCQELACPNCHLRVPRPLFESAPLFASIAGTPSCGKTYFLASMTWRLRHSLPKYFAMTFSDADPVSNLALNEYENQQFFNATPDALVKLAKTDVHGDLYDTVMYGDQLVEYPRPFLFSIRPSANHPNHAHAARVSRLLCLYDNAGESFEPGKDDVSAPVTRHLAQAQVLMFCFDPTQDPRLRKECQARTSDPQVVTALETRRQEAVFHELVDRVRRHAGLHQNQKYSRPLIIIVTKFDVWWPLIGEKALPSPWTDATRSSISALDVPLIDAVSQKVRAMLWQFSPEMVSAAEAFSDHVYYIPVSATGCSPEIDPESKKILGIRPRDIDPIWAEVPLLLTLARWGGGMIPFKTAQGGTSGANNGDSQTNIKKDMPPQSSVKPGSTR
jgi:hypothetical protein